MPDDPVLSQIREGLTALYGDKIDRIVLYGSRARGDAGADSDYDIAVFLKVLADKPAERRRLGDLCFAVMEETGQLLDVQAYAAEAYEQRSALMGELRREGRAL